VESVFAACEWGRVLEPEDDGSRFTAGQTRQQSRRVHGQRLVLRSLVDDWRRPQLIVYRHTCSNDEHTMSVGYYRTIKMRRKPIDPNI